MANRIKGITVEIGGDTTKLSKALESVNKNIKSTQTQLKDVEKLLKLDPKNTELETDAEDGDYLIVSGRFLMCLLERRIIYPTFNFTKKVSYAQIVNNVVYYNACRTGARKIPGLSIGDSSGSCWKQDTKLQIS